MSKLAKALTAAAGNAGGAGLTVEDVFSTYLYTGTGATQTITNGIDLDGEGGLVWAKGRSAAFGNYLFDTNRGALKYISSNTTNAEVTSAGSLTSFNSNGFTLGTSSIPNNSGTTFASWTFRKAEKFFDVVTWTGTGSTQTIAHNLGSAPGCIMVKSFSFGFNWRVYHASLTNSEYLVLSSTAAKASSSSVWANTTPTSASFTVGSDSEVNSNGQTYVAYLFASDAGGFGDDGSESIIKCGSYTGTGTTQEITLGFEPQWVLIKSTGATSEPWALFDVMRGMPVGGVTQYLNPNTSDAETNGGVEYISPTPTGFKLVSGSTLTNSSFDTGGYIYIAIRRPMKTPESGTEVFAIDTWDGSTLPTVISGFPVDMSFYTTTTGADTRFHSRLTGPNYLRLPYTSAEASATFAVFDYQDGYMNLATVNADRYSWMFKRATGFFDVVCYTGGGSSNYKYNHNLGVAPELIIIKSRSNETNVNYWPVKIQSVAGQKPLALNSAAENPLSSTSYWSSFTDTATEFATRASSTAYDVNATGYTYIAYLFATVAGVSKVGSYTGTGADLNVDCGFSAGARFVLIKRENGSGDWYVWDSVRGIVAGNDPYLLLNSTAAEVTSTDYIDPLASGFTVTSSAPAALNASGGTYIFLAIS